MKSALSLGLVAMAAALNLAVGNAARTGGAYLADIEIVTIGPFDCQFLVDVGFRDSCEGEFLLTFHADGTMEQNDRTDFRDGFNSQALGTWKSDASQPRSVTAKNLSLFYDPAGEATGYGVRELAIEFNHDLSAFSGEWVNSIYDISQDPLDPAAVPFAVVTGTVAARRIE